jgi:hypothetical protein
MCRDLEWKIPGFVALIEDKNGDLKLSRNEFKVVLDSIEPHRIEDVVDVLYVFAYPVANGRKIEGLIAAEDGRVAITLRIQEIEAETEATEEQNQGETAPEQPPEFVTETVSNGNYEYGIDREKDLVWVTYKPNNLTLQFSLSEVKRLYDSLPEQFTPKDMLAKAEELDFPLTYNQALALIRVFSHVEFDAEVRRVGNQLVAFKVSEGQLREEVRKKLRQEMEVIGIGFGEGG